MHRLVIATIMAAVAVTAFAPFGEADAQRRVRTKASVHRPPRLPARGPVPRRGGVYFPNCAAARAAGAAPIRRGQPGYALHLDRDRDGIACEWTY